MKRIIATGLLLIICLVNFTACGESGDILVPIAPVELPEQTNLDPEDQYNPETDYSYQFAGVGIAGSSTGYYFVDGDFLFYLDKASLEVVPLCSRPNCLHTKETDPTKVWKCNAFLGISNEYYPFVQYYNGKIYTISYFDQERGAKESQLVEISLDGSSRKKLGKVADPQGLAIHRGYLYYKTVSPAKTSIVRKRLDQIEGEPEVLHTYEHADLTCQIVALYGNHLYIDEMLAAEGVDFIVDKIYDYNLKTGTLTQILTTEEEANRGIRASICDVADGRLYYSITDLSTAYMDETTYKTGDMAGIMRVCDLDGGNRMELLEMKEVGELSGTLRKDENYYYAFLVNFLYDNAEVQSKKKVTVYDEALNKKVELSLGSLPFASDFCKGDSDYLLFRYKVTAEDNSGVIRCLAVVDKKEFENGNPELKTVFEMHSQESSPPIQWRSGG